MKLEVTVYREIKNMDYREMQKYLDHLYREVFKDGRNSVLKAIEKRLETATGELYEALQAIKAEVE